MNQLLESADSLQLPGERDAQRRALADELDALRAEVRAGIARELDEQFWARVRARLEVLPALEVRPAINATGVVLHTNLGRAVWPQEAIEAVALAARAAVLEIDPETGGRGRRERAVSRLLAQLSGAEAGLAVNNNAAALMLAVAALSRGRGTVLARTEMVEIGGSYRMPEVVEAAGARLIEVGTTNRVHLKDFEAALQDPDVGCVLRVHRSNFELHGFHGEPSTAELAELCHRYSVPLVNDLGSGVLHGAELTGLEKEPTVAAALRDGSDILTFSGDKLLGGPQAGLIVGSKPLVERLRADMLTRCLRLDKAMLAALEATLMVHALGEEAALARIPALQQLSLSESDLSTRAQHLAEAWSAAGLQAEPIQTFGRVGSGAAPIRDLPGRGVALTFADEARLEIDARALRLRRPGIFGRVQDGRLVFDLRTVAPSDDQQLQAAVIDVCTASN